ncbi:FAD-binding oxidoreductase [Mycolicibacterium brumae]|uniref:FAD-binding oxidoreductase n=1 Tax=Mycolicibacterium brumae TaxID=85968 RepID=A0A2G5PCV2_9MYCO|nr:FAD-binding oxidoreductase [Mycolicibacterium brumae]MCV7193157.1 FAD-binding oxidoreductase [Mycolicibacterium brumae]PIB75930.1 FAD-binding oxidoreductase [Mycolicibacterium brumae]RWA16595.1 hypothetical protein MBRU_07680 [Mycolicibacterium brumae DSM 44177]UWW09812.1 FAD-binding oxidoreductase [Mycolicibacterium brumae]
MTVTADEDLGSLIEGVVALPEDPDYLRCSPWNTAVEVAPRMVVFPRSASDVAATVRHAGAVGATVAVAATGHGALPVGPESILVHTGDMTDVAVDVLGRTARVGAGASWQHVLDAATPHGLAPLCGSAPSVGVVGFLTGGGIGPLVRTFGLSSDHVRSFEVVTGTGEILQVSPERHGDLFWGLRGGKATLGIVTAVEIDLPELPEFYGGAIYFDGDYAENVLRAWSQWCPGLPESVSTSVALLQAPDAPEAPPALAGRFVIAVRFAAVGDRGEALDLLTPIRAVAPALLDAVEVLPYAAIGAVHADPPHPMPVYEDHALLSGLPEEAVCELLRLAGPRAGSLQALVEVRQLGGAYARWPRQRSAFCHRDAAFAVTTIGIPVPELAEQVRGHAAAVLQALGPWSTGRQLPNFAPASDPSRLARCYDDDTLYQLAALAERYDPDGVLRAGQVARYVF